MPTFRDTFYSDYQPFAGGRQIRMAFGQNGSRVERPVLVGWREVSQAKQDFLGFSQVKVAGADSYISRTIPHAYEGETDTQGLPWLWAQDVPNVEAMGARGKRASGAPDFEQALMTVLYTSRTYGVFDDNNPGLQGAAADPNGAANPLDGLPDEATLLRYVTKLYKPTNRAITIPRALMQWVPQGAEPAAPIMEAIGKREPGIELTYVHHLRPDVPRAAIAQAMGKVNDAAFDGYEAGTLLCNEPDIEPIVLPIGEIAYDVHFHFRYLPKYDLSGTPRGHNWFLRCWTQAGVTSIDYRRVNTKSDGTGTDVFPTFNFMKLFRPDQ